ncbi:snare associated Golgi protein-domain-containing protein [Haematococcus lacustris]
MRLSRCMRQRSCTPSARHLRICTARCRATAMRATPGTQEERQEQQRQPPVLCVDKSQDLPQARLESLVQGAATASTSASPATPPGAFLEFFIGAVDEWGQLGVLAYAGVYIVLELLSLPAIPLTMTAGMIFGTLQGTAITSVSGTIAAAIAFLIARYAVRDKVRALAYSNPRFKAIDRAIGLNGLKFVTLLRLSPLLPLSASNYLYGLTSVDLGSYMLGSWVGMLPGTWAYVQAGYVGRAVFMEGEGALVINPWQVGLGLAATVLALGFVGQLAKKAIDEVEQEEDGKGPGSSAPAPVAAPLAAEGARAKKARKP